MPNTESHINLALHNIDCACDIIRQPSRHDWAAVMGFYAALHVVEAVFANQKQHLHGHTHNSRERILKSGKFSRMYHSYRPLKTSSLVARYLMEHASFAEYMNSHQVCSILLQKHLVEIITQALAIGNFEKLHATQLKQAIQIIHQASPPS